MGGVLAGLVAFVVLITIVIVVHEGGHYVVAKLSGIRVDEFSIGFGPRLFGRRRGETEYNVRALPFGGYVKMAGMLGLEGEADAGERNFYRATIPRKLLTIIAGIAFNFIFGALCMAVVLAQALPSSPTPQQAAYNAGLRDGDLITSLGGRHIDTSSVQAESHDLYAATSGSKGHPLVAEVTRAGGGHATFTITPQLVVYNVLQQAGGNLPQNIAAEPLVVTSISGHAPGTGDPADLLGGAKGAVVSGFTEATHTDVSGVAIKGVVDGDGSGTAVTAAWRIGYAPGSPGLGPVAAVGAGFGSIGTFVTETGGFLGSLIVHPSSQAAQQLSGPVGIAAAAGSAIQQGWIYYLFLIAQISFSLGFINVLPVPFLDGGRLLFIVIEAVRRRRLAPEREALIHAIGLAFLILIAVYVTIGDIGKLSGPH